MTYDRDLVDYPSGFDPMKTHLKVVFENPKARALWMAYRAWHICSDEDMEALKQGSLAIAGAVEKEPAILDNFDGLCRLIGDLLLGRSHSSYAFNHIPDYNRYENPKSVLRESEATRYTRFILPYLKGEKVASIKIREE